MTPSDRTPEWRGPEYAAALADYLGMTQSDPTREPTPSLDAMMAALHETAYGNHNIGEGPLRAICSDPSSHRDRAEAMLAALAYTEPSESREVNP